MSTPQAVDAARRIGARAGERYVRTGIWPRNPFRAPSSDPLAVAWRDGMFAVTGPATTAPRPEAPATPRP